MKDMRWGLVVALVVLTLLPRALYAQLPAPQEDFVYAITAFDGSAYIDTFARSASDTLYVLAGQPSFLSPRKTVVYFWPITEEWRADYRKLNEVFLSETLIIEQGRESEVQVSSVRYTYLNASVEGPHTPPDVFLGEEAVERVEQYELEMRRYWRQVDVFQRLSQSLENYVRESLANIDAMRREGQDARPLIGELESYIEENRPEPPARPSDRPREVQRAYLIDLPVGRYTIRLVDDLGRTYQGSEKNLVVYSHTRNERIGFEIIPADKWTRPEMSQTPSSVLYVDGTTDLYLKPFYQNEYNDLYYNKTIQNDARGNPRLLKWVRTRPVIDGTLEVSRQGDNNPDLIHEKQYFVDQSGGSGLGYTIRPMAELPRDSEEIPALTAYRVRLDPQDSVVRVELRDNSESYYSSASREIRIISRASLGTGAWLLTLLPVVLMVLVLAVRSRRYD